MESVEMESRTQHKCMSVVLDEVKARAMTNPQNYRHNENRQSVSTEHSLVMDDDFNEYSDDNIHSQSQKNNKGVKIKKEPTIICLWEDDCDLKFSEYEKYVFHMMEHANQTPLYEDYYTCGFSNCNFESPCSDMFLKHVIYHAYHENLKQIGATVAMQTNLPKCTRPYDFEVPMITSNYECEWEHCSMSLRTIYEYFIHIGYHIYANPYIGNISCGWKDCTMKVSKKDKLAEHVRSHSKQKFIACPDCGTMFVTKIKFQEHRNRQMPNILRTFQCSDCLKLFPTVNILRDHMRLHVNFYKCNLCDMTTAKPSNLASHIRTRHLDHRPFKCELCSYCSVTNSQLLAHMRTHIKENVFACEICDFTCRTERTLNCHNLDKHGDGIPRLYKCHCCDARYIRGRPLTQHLISKHGLTRPPGHSIFRYKLDTDGFFKLRTLRYEGVEITNEMMSKKDAVVSNLNYDVNQSARPTDTKLSYVLVSETGEENVVCPTNNEIIMTIDDVDANGHVLKSEVVQSNEIVNADVQCIRNADQNNAEGS